MNISISYKHVDAQKPVGREIEHYVRKLSRLLKSYEPDLLQLHAAFSRNGRVDEFACALTLSLPTGTLHATAAGAQARSSCKQAFSELETQVKKHQARLRKDYEWKRKRPLRRGMRTNAA